MHRKFISLKFFLSLMGLALTACQDRQEGIDDSVAVEKKHSIVVTTTQITDLAQRLVGDLCEITPLMGPGVDPHLYKPTARDVNAISSSDLVLYHGLKLEGKLAEILGNPGEKIKASYALCSAIPQKMLLAAEEGSSHPDPHVWFDPEIWKLCLRGLAVRLSALLPQFEDLIQERAIRLEKEIDEVAEWASLQFDQIPTHKRILVTSHDAFRYLGRSFNLKVVALQGISTVREAGLGDRSDLVEYIKANGITCLFVESSVNPKALQEIARETEATTGSSLYSDALGSPENSSEGPKQKYFPHDTWSGMMIFNARAIAEGLVR